jgi:hypothetical protein
VSRRPAAALGEAWRRRNAPELTAYLALMLMPPVKGDLAVHHQDLAVVAARVGHQAAGGRVVLQHGDPGRRQAVEEGPRRLLGAQAVVEEIDLHPFGLLPEQRLRHPPAHRVVREDEDLQVHVIAGGGDGAQHLREGGRAVHQRPGAIAGEDGGAADRLRVREVPAECRRRAGPVQAREGGPGRSGRQEAVGAEEPGGGHRRRGVGPEGRQGDAADQAAEEEPGPEMPGETTGTPGRTDRRAGTSHT